MTVFARVVFGGAIALLLSGSALADDVPAASTPLAQDPAAAARAAEHDRLMKETVCRSDDDDTGHHVRHRVCMTRAEWLAHDKHQAGYDPDTGRVIEKN